MGNIMLITGGVRSGKSALAEKLAATAQRVLYIATGEAKDDEMAARIRLHQERRPPHWGTIEAPLDLCGAVKAQDSSACLLIDCLGLWVSNHLLVEEEKHLAHPIEFTAQVRELTLALLDCLEVRQGDAILVTNEVGFGLVPPYKLGRVFCDCLGLVNATVAEAANDVYLCVAGMPVALKKGGVVRLG